MVFRRALGGLAAATAVGVSTLGMYSALRRTQVKHVPVVLPRLPSSLAGLRVVQLTDIHVGPTIGRGFIEYLVERVNALEADVVAITGDLVDGSVAELGEFVRPLQGLKAKHGVYFVTGNHEYYSGADEWIAFLGTLGIRVLRNEHITLQVNDDALALAGVDDWSAHQFGGDHGAHLQKALSGVPPQRPVLLLAHQPKAFPEAIEKKVDLQISGHTHGGQIFPFGWLARLDQPYIAGLYKEAESQLYVSRGTGYWGPPMRLAAPAEITLLELKASA